MAAAERLRERWLGPRIADVRVTRWSARSFFLIPVVAAAAGLALLLDYGYGRDQGIYSVVAGAMLDGGAPYKDAWDFKPPGIYLAFAAAKLAFGPSPMAIRWLEVLALASLFPACGLLARRAVGDSRAGWIGASLAIVGFVPFEFWHTAQPEGFGGVLLAWALVLATTERDGSHRPWLLGATRLEWLAWSASAGLFCCAALLKPPLGGGILVCFAVIVARCRRRGGAAAMLAPTLAFTLGGLLPLAATLSFFGLRGALADLYQIFFVFTPHYTRIGLESRGVLELVAETFSSRLGYIAPYNLPGLIFFFLLPKRGERERLVALQVLGAVAFALIGVGLQGKFFMYHYAAVVILLAMLAGCGWWKAWLAVRDRPLGWLALAALVWAISWPGYPAGKHLRTYLERASLRLDARLHPERRTPIHDRLHSLSDTDAGTNRRVGEWLARHTPPGEPIYIWGFEPVIYELAGRRPASRYIYNVPQRAPWFAAQSRRQLIADLRASPPSALVIVHEDRMPHVTGDLKDSAEILLDFDELKLMLISGYRFAGIIDQMEIYLRAPSP